MDEKRNNQKFSLTDNCSIYYYILCIILIYNCYCIYATYPHTKLLMLLFVVHPMPFCPHQCIVLLHNKIKKINKQNMGKLSLLVGGCSTRTTGSRAKGYAALRSWGTSVLWTSWCISAGPYTCSMSAKETTGTWVRTSRLMQSDSEVKLRRTGFSSPSRTSSLVKSRTQSIRLTSP